MYEAWHGYRQIYRRDAASARPLAEINFRCVGPEADDSPDRRKRNFAMRRLE
jgi:hypothetical protein